MNRKILTGLWMLVLALPLSAAELAGVKIADSATVGEQQLVLNGVGLREKVWVDVYVGALYLPAKTTETDKAIDPDGASRVEMHFVHDAPAEKIIAAWDEGFENNNPKKDFEAVAERIKTFNGYFATDTKTGDVMVFDMVPGVGTTVTINGEVKGTIEGDDFARALRRVWLGPKPPSKDLRNGMMGRD